MVGVSDINTTYTGRPHFQLPKKLFFLTLVCNAGYEGVGTGAGCSLCPESKYKPSVENGLCLDIPENASPKDGDKSDFGGSFKLSDLC